MYASLRDPRTPWYAKLAAGCVVAYAISPIDLIPDPIPVLGHLDDLVLIPLGVWLVRRLIPATVIADARAAVDAGVVRAGRVGLAGAIAIVALWVLTIVAMIWAGLRIPNWTHTFAVRRWASHAKRPHA